MMAGKTGVSAVLLVLGWILPGAAPAEWTPEQEVPNEYDTLRGLIPRCRGDKRIGGQALHPQAWFHAGDRDPTDVVVRRTSALLDHLKGAKRAGNLWALEEALASLKVRAKAVDVKDADARMKLFVEAVMLRRMIAFANPLLSFDKILFVKRAFLPPSEGRGNHMCDQYMGFHAIRTGGIFVLGKAFSPKPTVRDVLADSVCKNGRFKGRKLPPGGYLSPELSFDSKTILFAFTEAEPTRYRWSEKSTFHIFKVNVDGSGLVQLTDGKDNDFDPCWLPNGRIAFISGRRGGFGRCHGRPVPTWTVHAMNADGSGIDCISPHETNEWHPSVDNDGMIVYTRWDYVDRGHGQAHHPWVISPDGLDARAIQGNFGKARNSRPNMEMNVRAIPGSRRLIATATPHHGQAFGSLVMIDRDIPDDDAMAPVKRITPEVRFPESDGSNNNDIKYATAWPLDEMFYLCVYDPTAQTRRGTANNHGIYLVDAFGNKELIYRDPSVGCLDPIPLRPRKRPPIVPQRATPLKRGPGDALVTVINVYDALKPWPEGTKIKSLRIVQVLPKSTPRANSPRIGYGSQKNARAVLGTVPVEADGSVHFRMPVDKPVFFQVLDGSGMAVQSMRSDTWVRPGQHLVCQGCHDQRHLAPRRPKRIPLALRRAASRIQPEADGANPFSFPRLVQPVLEKHCVACHVKEPKALDLRKGDYRKNRNRWYTSYIKLQPYAFFFTKDAWTVPRTTPGKFGARASKLVALLAKGHYKVKLSAGDMRRITLWLDSNSDFFGAYENLDDQAEGKIVKPAVE